jgi:hypothetical protein
LTFARADDKPAAPKKAATPEQAVEFLAAASNAGDVEGALNQIAQPFQDLIRFAILQEEADDILKAALDAKFGTERRDGFRPEAKYDLLRIRKVEILAKEKQSDTRVQLTVREAGKSFHHAGEDIIEMPYLAVKDGDQWKLLRPFTALMLASNDKDMTEKSSREKGADGKEIDVYKLTFKKDLAALGDAMRQRLEKDEGKQMPVLLAQAKQPKTIAETLAADIKSGKYKTRKEAAAAFEEAVRRAEKKEP